MPFEFRIDKEERIVYSTLSGELNVNELIEGLTEVLADEDFEPGISGITDLRSLRWESDQEDLRRLTRFVIEHKDRIGKSRSAVVVSGDRAYGMTRMFEVFSEQSSLEIGVFRDIDKARKWVTEGSGGE
jgi:hypothetical protein